MLDLMYRIPGTICAAPEVMIRICSSTDSIGYPPFAIAPSPKTAVLEVHKLSYDNKLTRRSIYDRKILVLPHASMATGRRVPSRSTR